MSAASDVETPGLMTRFKEARRKWVKQFGKRLTFLISQSISLLGYAAFWWCFDPANPWMMLLPMPQNR